MADDDTTRDTEEDTEDTEAFEDEDLDGDDTPDPYEGLHALVEELVPLENESTGQVGRIKAVADSLREKLTACQEALATDGGSSPTAVADAVSVLIDQNLFMLEELSETFMPYLAGLATATRENVLDIRDWGEQEVEPFLEQMAGGLQESTAEGSVLLPNDGQAIDALLAELHWVLSNTAGRMPEDSDERQAVKARLAHIEKIRAHVQGITLADEENLS